MVGHDGGFNQAVAVKTCSHVVRKIELLPAGYAYHAREVCVRCGRLTQWLTARQYNARRFMPVGLRGVCAQSLEIAKS